MKPHTIVVALGLGWLTAGAQEFCGTSEKMQRLFRENPGMEARYYERRNKVIQEEFAAAANQSALKQTSTYTIPVVFHILHTGGNENISDAQVIDAVNILNRDFNKLNADTSNVVAAFKNMIGNPGISFSLATIDPLGNCTNGIIRYVDSNTVWTEDPDDYKYSWPSAQYMNVYVVKSMSGNTAGYTYFPGWVTDPIDAIVILHNYVGSFGASSSGHSRVLTHEVGHWLDLPHTWGFTNNPGVACGDDGVFDTPPTMGHTSCQLASASCNPPVVENVQNYMEYAYCARMFTHGQATRMQSAMNGPYRYSLTTPGNLFATGVTSQGLNCVTKLNLSVTGATICSGGTMVMNTYTSNAAVDSFSWTATNGAVVQSPTLSSASVLFPNTGTCEITCVATNSAGSVTAKANVIVKNGMSQVTGAYTEGFELDMNLPVNWTQDGSSAFGSWQVTNQAAATGANAVFVPGQLTSEAIHILESPSYDLKKHASLDFSFKYAYARKNTTVNDQFSVLASTDCGGTWKEIFKPGMGPLAASSGGIQAGTFAPQANQWKTVVLSALPSFASLKTAPCVTFRFVYQEDEYIGQTFYLDDINLDVEEDLSAITNFEFSNLINIYPNPAHGYLHLSLSRQPTDVIHWQILSLTGGVIHDGELKGDAILDVSGLAPGMYFFTASDGVSRTTRKVVIE